MFRLWFHLAWELVISKNGIQHDFSIDWWCFEGTTTVMTM